ncbi:long tail fiber protein [Escherichia phage EP1]|uniref:Long tail fiber protein n=1 Tax=Escherichia phage EP1 TaxID=3110411 RepID=A0ABZ0ZZ46_9CAUD|nr:long tail fiber protein [Escherichia phage EP1]
MAEFKLSELNSISEIRSDDLLHVRVKKRTEMLGDEDRRMTYADFLASFRLERFLQLVGGTMTGNLGIVKLTYGGKDLLDPTGNSEIVFGDTAKTFKLNANGLKLTIADASRSATVYHTLNKPSPNELGMRTNDENDARFAIKGTQNTFTASQIFQTDNAGLTLKNTAAAALYYEGRDTANAVRFTIGNLSSGSDVTIANTKQNTNIVLGTGSVGINKSLQVTGQVVPSDFANFDARFYTRDAADQRFVQLAAANTITGNNTLRGTTTLLGDGARLTLKNLTSGKALYIEGQNTDASMKWAVGNYADGSNSVVLTNISNDTYVLLDNMVRVNKSLAITGQVQPTDWSNIDARFIPAATLSTIARNNTANTFTGVQTIKNDGQGLVLMPSSAGKASYIISRDSDGTTNRWFIGVGSDGSTTLSLQNHILGSSLQLANEIVANKSVNITGQVKPSDFANFDSRYYTKSLSDLRYEMIGSISPNSSGTNGLWVKVATVVMPQSTSTVEMRFAGGAGYNAGSTAQAAPTSIILRTGNNSTPVGITAVLWNSTDTSPLFTDIGYVSNGSNSYDIYAKSGGYAHSISFSWRCTSNAAVSMYTTPEGSVTPPTSMVSGSVQSIYTSLLKPSASDVGAYTKTEVDQKIANAVTDSTDLKKVYPVGIVTWFATNQNPNTTLPGLTWTYLNEGVGRTVRIGAANGSDVKTVGGADTVTLAVGHLPSHTHSFSATTSSFDYGTKTSNTTGAHTHSVSGSAASAGSHKHAISWIGQNSTHYSGGGGGKLGTGPGYTDAGGAHTHTISGTAASAGNHAHTVGIGAHTHTVSGDTGGTGSGSAFSVVNLFIRLMAWVRTA